MWYQFSSFQLLKIPFQRDENNGWKKCIWINSNHKVQNTITCSHSPEIKTILVYNPNSSSSQYKVLQHNRMKSHLLDTPIRSQTDLIWKMSYNHIKRTERRPTNIFMQKFTLQINLFNIPHFRRCSGGKNFSQHFLIGSCSLQGCKYKSADGITKGKQKFPLKSKASINLYTWTK